MDEKQMVDAIGRVADLAYEHKGAYTFIHDGRYVTVKSYRCNKDRYQVTFEGLTPERVVEVFVGAGTCKDLGGIGANGEQVFHCSECGCVLSLYDRDGSNNLCTSFVHDYPRFCPECGRRIIEEEAE